MQTTFYLRTERPLKDGRVPIWIYVTWDGLRKRMGTGRKVLEKNWDAKKERVKSGEPYYTRINMELQEIASAAIEIYENAKLQSIQVTEEYLAAELQKVIDPERTQRAVVITDMPVAEEETPVAPIIQEPTIELICQRYMEKNDKLKSHNYLRNYKQLMPHIHGFRRGATVKEVDYDWLHSFAQYLLNDAGHENNTAAGHIKRLKRLLRYAQTLGHTICNNIDEFNLAYIDPEIFFLSPQELEQLEAFEAPTEKLQHIKDVFLFSCYTGLRHSDLFVLTNDNIKYKVNSKVPCWLEFTIVKTKKRISIPVIEKAKAILDRYKDDPRRPEDAPPLPVISLSNSNLYLKELGKLARLNATVQRVYYKGSQRHEERYKKYELMSMHWGRHTFATIFILRGGSLLNLSKLLGHSNISITAKYPKVLDMDIENQVLQTLGFDGGNAENGGKNLAV